MKINYFKEIHDFMAIIYQSLRSPTYRRMLIKTMYHNACVMIDENGEENRDRIIYYIRYVSSCGFFALWRFTLASLDFSDEMGFTPVIDWEGQQLYSEDGPVNGTMNPYEYYFEQPASVSVESAKKSRHVVFSENSRHKTRNHICPDYDLYDDEYRLKRLAELQRKYIRINEATRIKLERDVNSLGIQGTVIGVHVRGSDFALETKGHPKRSNVGEYIHAVIQYIKEYGAKYVFLATDDIHILEAFREKFRHRLVYFNDVERSSDYVGVHFMKDNRENHHYLLGYEVLRDVYVLSRCDYLIAGSSNVSLAARVFAEADGRHYKKIKFIYHGLSTNYRKKRLLIWRYNKYRKNTEKPQRNTGSG